MAVNTTTQTSTELENKQTALDTPFGDLIRHAEQVGDGAYQFDGESVTVVEQGNGKLIEKEGRLIRAQDRTRDGDRVLEVVASNDTSNTESQIMLRYNYATGETAVLDVLTPASSTRLRGGPVKAVQMHN